MPDVLVASDAEHVHHEIRSILGSPDTKVRSVYSGAAVLPEVEKQAPDLAVVDMQIGNMGGMAVSLELHLEAAVDRIDEVPVLLLLDRRPDVFLARRSEAEGWLLKPLDPIRLRRAAQALIDGGVYHDTAYLPEPVAVPIPSGTVEGSGK